MVLKVKVKPGYKQASVNMLSVEDAFIKQVENELDIDEVKCRHSLIYNFYDIHILLFHLIYNLYDIHILLFCT
jgi:hypothetical protein